MSRAPEAGRTKSRLAAAIGHDAAARLAEAMLLDAAAAVRAAEGMHPALFVEPAPAVAALAALTAIEDARAQARGHIGRRMHAAFEALSADGFGPIVVVGADIPDADRGPPRRRSRGAPRGRRRFRAGRGRRLLPGGDVGARDARLFEDATIEWGGTRVLATSEHAALARGMRTVRLPMERDIDTIEDLAWLRARLAALAERGEPVPPHTAEMLRGLPGGQWAK